MNKKFQHFVFPFEAVAKQRVRVVSGRAFTPQKTKDFESDVRMILKEKKAKKTLKPCFVSISFLIKKPKKPSKSYPSKCDLDNYAKAMLDACNGILYEDDSQVCSLLLNKSFCNGDPCIYLSVVDHV